MKSDNMEYFTVLPMWNYSGKQIKIIDLDEVQVGFIQRKYRGFWDKLLHNSPITLSFLEKVSIDGEDYEHCLRIREHSFKANLLKLKWDVFLSDSTQESQFLLEDKTKISTNPRMVYHKNNKAYLFKIDLFNRTCEVSSNEEVCATIRIEKKIPRSLKTVVKTGDLSIIELLSIYYVITLNY